MPVSIDKLIKFENKVAQLFNSGKLKELIHLSGGNEKKLINIFKKVKRGDWIVLLLCIMQLKWD